MRPSQARCCVVESAASAVLCNRTDLCTLALHATALPASRALFSSQSHRQSGHVHRMSTLVHHMHGRQPAICHVTVEQSFSRRQVHSIAQHRTP